MDKTIQTPIEIDKHNSFHEEISIEAKEIDNAVLNRLIKEINFERENRLNSYNRVHNRHNRGR